MQFILGLFLIFATAGAVAQQYSTPSTAPVLPDAPPRSSSTTLASETKASASTAAAWLPDAPSYAAQQGSGTTPLTPISRQFFSPTTPNGVAYPQLVFFGGTSASTEAGGARQAQQGSSAGNCGRRSADKNAESGWLNSLLSVTSKSGNYCVLGEGGFWKRGTYAMGRAFAAHKYDNLNWFNGSNFFAPGVTQGVPAGYYLYQGYSPYQYDAGERLATRYASAVGRDTLKNMFREFWPDISSHVLKRHP